MVYGCVTEYWWNYSNSGYYCPSCVYLKFNISETVLCIRH
jgi:hypothetical protein